MLAFQTGDGRFHNILDESDNFLDGTSGLMTAAAVFRGILHEYIRSSFYSAAEAACKAAADHMDEM